MGLYLRNIPDTVAWFHENRVSSVTSMPQWGDRDLNETWVQLQDSPWGGNLAVAFSHAELERLFRGRSDAVWARFADSKVKEHS